MNRQGPPIVVGINGSDRSLAALRWALGEAEMRGAPVRVVHCRPRHPFGGRRRIAERRGSICMLDNEVAAALRDVPTVVTVDPVSVAGRPASALVDAASDARLLVIGGDAKGEQGETHGHTVRDCLRHATCPVVVIERAEAEASVCRAGSADRHDRTNLS